MMPALEVSSPTSGSTCARSRTSSSTSSRPKKSPRAFCAPIEVPGRVVLVIQPMGGADDWRALFHEAGHTEHYAHVNPDLPVEARRLGDVSVTEAWATLMEHFLLEPGWLASRLDFPRPDEFAAEAAAGSLYLLRRYCGKLLYELEFHAATELDEKAMSSLTSSSSEAPSRSSPARRTTSATSTPASTSPATSARGRCRRSSATTSATASARRGSRTARRAACSASSGARAAG